MRLLSIITILLHLQVCISAQTLSVVEDFPDPNLKWPFLWDIEQDKSGTLYTCSEDGVLYYKKSTTWKKFDLNGNATDDARCIAIDSTGVVWVGTENGLFSFKDDKVIKHYTTSNSKLPNNEVNGVRVYQNQLWLYFSETGIALKQGEVFTSYTETNSTLPSNYIDDLEIMKDGTVIVASSEDVTFIKGNNFTNYDLDKLISWKTWVSDIFIDHNQQLWFATQTGIVKYDKVNDAFVSMNSKYGNKKYSTVNFTPKNELWLGETFEGIHHYDAKDKHTFLKGDSNTNPSQIFDLLYHKDTMRVIGNIGASVSKVFFPSAPQVLTTSIAATSALKCFGDKTTLNSTVTGGTAPYAYLWNTGATTPTLPNAKSGEYKLSITDSKGVKQNSTITITEPSDISVAIGTTSASDANMANGTVIMTPKGGTLPYTYTFTPSVTNLQALKVGNYTVTTTDANGCTKVGQFTIGAALNATISKDIEIKCQGAKTGTLSANPTGGVSPYSYIWNNNATSKTITGIGAGTYQVTITDNKSEKKIVSIILTEPNAITLTSTSKPGNPQYKNGTATVSTAGGTIPYTYAWSTTPVQKTSTAINLAPTTYTVTVTDANNCTATRSVIVGVSTSTNEIWEKHGITCYPNPANEVLNIKLTGTIQSDMMISIFDMQGKEVIHTQIYVLQHQIDISQLAEGTYILKLQLNQKESAVSTLTIQR
jgi:frataxin-like iron-binding protein CyaY